VIEPGHLASKAALRLAESRQVGRLIVWDGIGSIRLGTDGHGCEVSLRNMPDDSQARFGFRETSSASQLHSQLFIG
jgi:hypothetical protein